MNTVTLKVYETNEMINTIVAQSKKSHNAIKLAFKRMLEDTNYASMFIIQVNDNTPLRFERFTGEYWWDFVKRLQTWVDEL